MKKPRPKKVQKLLNEADNLDRPEERRKARSLKKIAKRLQTKKGRAEDRALDHWIRRDGNIDPDPDYCVGHQ